LVLQKEETLIAAQRTGRPFTVRGAPA